MTNAMMKLARVHGPGDVRLDDVAVPQPGQGEVVVQVRACGICGSDLGYIAAGGLRGVEPLKEPLPIGHEFAGSVAGVGPGVEGVAPGMRVAVNPDLGYIGGGGADGAMARYIRISGAQVGKTLFPLADTVSFELAALAEPLSVALHGLRLTGVRPGDKVAVLGAGPIGLCTVAMLRHLGAGDIAIFDRVDSRLERAKALGATLAVNVERETMTEALSRLHGQGERFGAPFVGTDVFIDAAGAAPALTEVMNIVKYRARIAIIALYKKPCPIDLFKLMANEITLVGSIADDRSPEFGEALTMIAGGKQDLSPLISHSFDFENFHEALAVAGDAQQSAKVMLTFTENA